MTCLPLDLVRGEDWEAWTPIGPGTFFSRTGSHGGYTFSNDRVVVDAGTTDPAGGVALYAPLPRPIDLRALLADPTLALELGMRDAGEAYLWAGIFFGVESSTLMQGPYVGWQDCLLSVSGKRCPLPTVNPTLVVNGNFAPTHVAFVAQLRTPPAANTIRIGTLRLIELDAARPLSQGGTRVLGGITATPIALTNDGGTPPLPVPGFCRRIEIANSTPENLRVGYAGEVSTVRGMRVLPNERYSMDVDRSDRLEVCSEVAPGAPLSTSWRWAV